jgi:hypothetical protein
MAPPLGGAPWRKDFVDRLVELNGDVSYQFRTELDKRSWYSTKHMAADDRYHAVQNLLLAWQSATRYALPESVGMFEVRLLSAVLTAARSIPLAMLAEKKEETVFRPAGSFLNDLRVAAEVLSFYTGADAEEITARSTSQADLMAYLGSVRDNRR